LDKTLVALIAVALVAWTSSACSASLGVLVPVQQGDAIRTKPGPGGGAMPILERAPDGALYRKLIKESQRGTVAFVLKLDEQAQRINGQKAQPTWLLLTDEEGGFAKRGFWLREHRNDRFVDQPYVALVVDTGSVTDGSFEEIFAHETGHVLLRRLLPKLPAGMSRIPHGSLTITDDPTAFDEGFATHFQALTRLMTVNLTLKEHDVGLAEKPFTPLWQSNVDGTLRIDGVRRNWFIHRQLLPPGDDDAVALLANSSAFDVAALKNGNQMMASEGVVATLFYRAMAPDPSVARYASLFRALQHLDKQALRPDSPLMALLTESWMSTDPAEGARFAKTFVETTYGATIDSALPQATAVLARLGRIGKQQAFVEHLQPARAELAALVERITQQPTALTTALGPALWIATTQPLVLNLNTAETDQLGALDGSLAEWSVRIVAERDARGAYSSWGDLVRRVGLPESLAIEIQNMAAAAVTLGTYPRL
jgi:hypothetical protein